jgi:hypothetical protein
MRKIVLGLGISLDGYIARSNGAVDFLFMPKDYSMVPFFATKPSWEARHSMLLSKWAAAHSRVRRLRPTSSPVPSRRANGTA